MKNNFTFFAAWFPTLLIASMVTALLSGTLQMMIRFMVPDNYSLQNFIVYAIVTVIICASLASVSAKLGSELNKGSKETSTGVPVINMLISAVIYVVLYIIMKGRALVIFHLFPCEMFLSNCVLGERAAYASISEKIIFSVLQFSIYIAVSLLFYTLAKKKQECSEGTKKLRGEKKKSNNRFGIDIDI
ncbi:MAG: hypothetical protein IKL24_04440 [Clostridia bacterium]|nr:hypothetical protein [Clostridia bacterium]